LDKVQSLPIRKIVVTNAPADLIKNALHGYDFEVFSCNNDPSKVEPEFYANFLEHYNLNPQDCSYFDHKQANIDSAKQVGINGVLFENNDQVMAYFSEMM
jgi:HAD superfamily hydrolase (TIGR01509 family)